VVRNTGTNEGDEGKKMSYSGSDINDIKGGLAGWKQFDHIVSEAWRSNSCGIEVRIRVAIVFDQERVGVVRLSVHKSVDSTLCERGLVVETQAERQNQQRECGRSHCRALLLLSTYISFSNNSERIPSFIVPRNFPGSPVTFC